MDRIWRSTAQSSGSRFRDLLYTAERTVFAKPAVGYAHAPNRAAPVFAICERLTTHGKTTSSPCHFAVVSFHDHFSGIGFVLSPSLFTVCFDGFGNHARETASKVNRSCQNSR
ncbi:hypothetical protein KCV07_g248, partial [Aureobasidium melanogenum]